MAAILKWKRILKRKKTSVTPRDIGNFATIGNFEIGSVIFCVVETNKQHNIVFIIVRVTINKFIMFTKILSVDVLSYCKFYCRLFICSHVFVGSYVANFGLIRFLIHFVHS